MTESGMGGAYMDMLNKWRIAVESGHTELAARILAVADDIRSKFPDEIRIEQLRQRHIDSGRV